MSENTIIRFEASSTVSNALALRQFLIQQAQQNDTWPAIVKLTIPAAFTSTTLGIEGSDDGTTFQALGDFRGAYTQASVVANAVIRLPEHVTRDWRFIRLTSSATQAAPARHCGRRVVHQRAAAAVTGAIHNAQLTKPAAKPTPKTR